MTESTDEEVEAAAPYPAPADEEVHAAAVAIDPDAWEPGPLYWNDINSSARDLSINHARAALSAARDVRDAQTDWEWGERSRHGYVWKIDQGVLGEVPPDARVRRRKAGPWEEVK